MEQLAARRAHNPQSRNNHFSGIPHVKALQNLNLLRKSLFYNFDDQLTT